MAENGKGALFKNDRKVPDSKQPDWTGSIDVTPALLQALLKEALVNGSYKARIAAWLRTSQNGRFLSLSLEAPFVGGTSRPQADSTVTPIRKKDPFDDDMPF